MPVARAKSPFEFRSCHSLTLITGLQARNLPELRRHLAEVPERVIYHHTHRSLLDGNVFVPGAPNDFANWVSNALLEKTLGEELTAVDVMRFSDVEMIREELLRVIDEFGAEKRRVRMAPPGQDFRFMYSVNFIMPAEYRAYTLSEFRDALARISFNSISYHILDARFRLTGGHNDFSRWMVEFLEDEPLAAALREVDPYLFTHEALRSRLLELIDQRLGGTDDA